MLQFVLLGHTNGVLTLSITLYYAMPRFKGLTYPAVAPFNHAVTNAFYSAFYAPYQV